MGTAFYCCAKCGESIKIRRSSNARDTERYAKWLESQGRMCDPCYADNARAEHAAKVAAAAADPLTAALPVLAGTDKEVAWAQVLRLEALPAIDKAVDEIILQVSDRDELSDAAREEMIDAVHLIASERRERSDARAWIDTRGQNALTELRSELMRRSALVCPLAAAELDAMRQSGKE